MRFLRAVAPDQSLELYPRCSGMIFAACSFCSLNAQMSEVLCQTVSYQAQNHVTRMYLVVPVIHHFVLLRRLTHRTLVIANRRVFEVELETLYTLGMDNWTISPADSWRPRFFSRAPSSHNK